MNLVKISKYHRSIISICINSPCFSSESLSLELAICSSLLCILPTPFTYLTTCTYAYRYLHLCAQAHTLTHTYVYWHTFKNTIGTLCSLLLSVNNELGIYSRAHTNRSTAFFSSIVSIPRCTLNLVFF